MKKIYVRSFLKLLTTYKQALRSGELPSAKEIAALIGCTVGHAYNYRHTLEEITRLQKSGQQKLVQLKHYQEWANPFLPPFFLLGSLTPITCGHVIKVFGPSVFRFEFYGEGWLFRDTWR